jgi:hypothetical protein
MKKRSNSLKMPSQQELRQSISLSRKKKLELRSLKSSFIEVGSLRSSITQILTTSFLLLWMDSSISMILRTLASKKTKHSLFIRKV